MDPKTRRCPACFVELSAAACAACGWSPGADNQPPCLAQGVLLDGRYQVGRVLGHGGFGITYLGWDVNLKTRRAIKEYLPSDLATRAPGQTRVAVFTGERAQHFHAGLERFLKEAEILARFEQHPGIVNVVSFFSDHGTGYMVMEHLDGVTLREYLEQQGGRLELAAAVNILMPVMDALRAVHKDGLLHRDIAPDNIHITRQGMVKLLDFGAARQSTQGQSRSLSVILKPGYAPEEQYQSRAAQGAYTDVYAVAATLYRCITGQTPPEALERLRRDPLEPPTRLGAKLTPDQEAVILQGLACEPEQRYSTMEGFQQALRAASLGMAPPEPPPDPPPDPPPVPDPLPPDPKRGLIWGALLLVTLLGIGYGGWAYYQQQSQQGGNGGLVQPDESVEQDSQATRERAARDRDDAAWQSAQEADDEAAYQAYLSGCGDHPCARRDRAEARLAELQRQRETEARKERDRAAWQDATRADDKAAYNAYLADCAANGCAYAGKARERLRAIKEQEEQMARRDRDDAAWQSAREADDEAAYQAYLAGCTDHPCTRRDQAEGRLAAIKAERERQRAEQERREREERLKQQRLAADRAAWREAQALDTINGYRRYLSSCSEHSCGHRGEAEKRIEELERQARLARLTVRPEPADARVRILHIRPVYADGMELEPGRYEIEVTAQGYKPYRQWHELGSGAVELEIELEEEARIKEPAMVTIPAGSFRMGDLQGGGASDEKPVHTVNLKAFRMGQYEVTNAQYVAFLNAVKRRGGEDEPWFETKAEDSYSQITGSVGAFEVESGKGNHPVVNVSWYGAKAYADWLSRETGKAYRLPSEAEWEYAARAGTSDYYWFGDCIDTDKANYDGNYDWKGCGKTEVYRKATLPVDSFAANPWGLYNVHGNVWEWTEDCWNNSYEDAPTNGSAWRHGNCSSRVLRGGSWFDVPGYLRAAGRGNFAATDRSSYVGFRLAQDL